ncbi:MAG: hypothetical protein WDN28_22640 [Chthoniobacter sp.]
MIQAILAGERDPVALSELCDVQILQKKRAEVAKSLQGQWQEHHLFALRQALESYEFCRGQMAACDREIEALLQRVTRDRPGRSRLRRGRRSKWCGTTPRRLRTCMGS